jgi:hypothetical protein
MTSRTVTELNPTPLADLIVNSAFPIADTGADYWHYTSAQAAADILATSTFRLYAVTRRLHENEYRPFCVDHDCSGYLATDPTTGRPIFEGLCRDLFYGSFVKVGTGNEAHMWRVIASQGAGVRLRLRIRPTLDRAELRPVVYANARSQTLVSAVMKAVVSAGAPPFVLRGISRVAAFYLRFDSSESETRLLIKRHANGVTMATDIDGTYEYLPITLQADHEWCRLDILGVECGAHMERGQSDEIEAAWSVFQTS